MSTCLWPHGLQHTRLSCPSPFPGVCSNSGEWVGGGIKSSRYLSSPSPPAFNLSQYQYLFQWVSSSHQIAKYWSFSFSISLCNEESGLISFRIDWFDLLAVQGTLKNRLQHHRSKASMPWCFSLLYCPALILYMTTGKTLTLTIQIFVGKVISLFFNTLSRLVIAFLPTSKLLLISWLQSLSTMTLKPKKIKCHCLHCFPIYLPWSDGTGSHDLCFWM